MTDYAAMRKPKLVELSIQRGIDPAGKTKAQLVALLQAPPVEASASVLTQPQGMTDEAAVLWAELAPRVEARGDALPEDAMMLSAFCEAMATADRVRSALRAPIVRNENTGTVRTSPALDAWSKATLTALRFAEHFGWTPLARARMGVADAPDDAPEAPRAELYGSRGRS